MNFHIQGKYSKLQKQTELEVLYQKLLQLKDSNQVTINPNITDHLRSEGRKHRNTKSKSALTPELKNAAKSLKTNENIVVKRADKSACYVVMNVNEYMDKISSVLSDSSKFQKLNKDPTDNVKSKANKLITTLNAVKNDIKISKIAGDFSPGYLYGSVKLHKPNNPLRPIISQVTTPTYELAKQINNIITPFIPNKFMLNHQTTS